jgi:hypothetical protein
VDLNDNDLKRSQMISNNFIRKYGDKPKKFKEKFTKLWLTHSVIYPKNFNISIQKVIHKDFNHIEI